MQDSKIKDKLIFFEPQEDSKKKLELMNKILPLISGYTLSQIQCAFRFVENSLKKEYVIDLQDKFLKELIRISAPDSKEDCEGERLINCIGRKVLSYVEKNRQSVTEDLNEKLTN